MASRRLKLTAFSRMLIFLIFFIPIAYIGASYYNGQDGIENVKNLIGLNETSNNSVNDNSVKPENKQSESSSDKPSSSYKNNLELRVKRLEAENKMLKKEILDLKTEISELKSR